MLVPFFFASVERKLQSRRCWDGKRPGPLWPPPYNRYIRIASRNKSTLSLSLAFWWPPDSRHSSTLLQDRIPPFLHSFIPHLLPPPLIQGSMSRQSRSVGSSGIRRHFVMKLAAGRDQTPPPRSCSEPVSVTGDLAGGRRRPAARCGRQRQEEAFSIARGVIYV